MRYAYAVHFLFTALNPTSLSESGRQSRRQAWIPKVQVAGRIKGGDNFLARHMAVHKSVVGSLLVAERLHNVIQPRIGNQIPIFRHDVIGIGSAVNFAETDRAGWLGNACDLVPGGHHHRWFQFEKGVEAVVNISWSNVCRTMVNPGNLSLFPWARKIQLAPAISMVV